MREFYKVDSDIDLTSFVRDYDGNARYEVSPYGWLNDLDKQAWGTGFGDYQLDLAATASDGTFFTTMRWYQYTIEEYRQGMPHTWRRPKYTAPYYAGWIPMYFNSSNSYSFFALLNVGGAASAALVGTTVMVATLAAIAN